MSGFCGNTYKAAVVCWACSCIFVPSGLYVCGHNWWGNTQLKTSKREYLRDKSMEQTGRWKSLLHFKMYSLKLAKFSLAYFLNTHLFGRQGYQRYATIIG